MRKAYPEFNILVVPTVRCQNASEEEHLLSDIPREGPTLQLAVRVQGKSRQGLSFSLSTSFSFILHSNTSDSFCHHTIIRRESVSVCCYSNLP